MARDGWRRSMDKGCRARWEDRPFPCSAQLAPWHRAAGGPACLVGTRQQPAWMPRVSLHHLAWMHRVSLATSPPVPLFQLPQWDPTAQARPSPQQVDQLLPGASPTHRGTPARQGGSQCQGQHGHRAEGHVGKGGGPLWQMGTGPKGWSQGIHSGAGGFLTQGRGAGPHRCHGEVRGF